MRKLYLTCRISLFAALATAPAVSVASAQESLFVCGHKFTLLTPVDAALKEVTVSSECSTRRIEGGDSDSPSYFLVSKSKPEVVHGELSFLLNRLSSVSMNWDVDVHNEIDYGRVVIGLLHKFEEYGCTNYKTRTSYQSTPELDSKTAFLSCGSRRIMLVSSEYKGAKSIQITETLGI